MNRQIFKKISMSEKRTLLQGTLSQKSLFHAKGESDPIASLVLNEYHEGRLLVFEYAKGSPRLEGVQTVIFNFIFGEDRYYFQAKTELFPNRVLVPADVDVYILQRRKTPRLDLPDEFPGVVNIVQVGDRTGYYECKILDFGSGGLKAHYPKDLPRFASGDGLKMVLNLSHRRPLEIEGEIRHHRLLSLSQPNSEGYNPAWAQLQGQVFGVQFKFPTPTLENKLLITFMDLQRELFTKWNKETT